MQDWDERTGDVLGILAETATDAEVELTESWGETGWAPAAAGRSLRDPDAEAPDQWYLSRAAFRDTVATLETQVPEVCPAGHYLVTVQVDREERGLTHLSPLSSLPARMRLIERMLDRQIRVEPEVRSREDALIKLLAPMLVNGSATPSEAERLLGGQLVEYYIRAAVLAAGAAVGPYFTEGASIFLDITTNQGGLSETLYLQRLPVGAVN